MDEKPEEHLAFQFAPLYASLQQAFEAIFERARSQRVIFVIDEFPYLAKADPSVSSILQALIDRASADSKLLLLLCGSSLSFMKEQVLGEKSPLYGRRTAQIELKPFDFFTAHGALPPTQPHRDSRNIRHGGRRTPLSYVISEWWNITRAHRGSAARPELNPLRGTEHLAHARGVEGIAIQRGHRRHRKWTNPERGDSNRNWLHHSGNLVLPQRA